MVFHIEPHIQKAKAILDSNEIENFPHACLELRFALEKVAYYKLKQRMDKITFEEIEKSWQPSRVIEALAELVDEHILSDGLIRIQHLDQDTQEPVGELSLLGKNKGIKPKEINKKWQTMGSYLHIRLPKKKKSSWPSNQDQLQIKKSITETIKYLEDLSSTKFDFHLSESLNFPCPSCSQTIVRNINLLDENRPVHCQNPHCKSAFFLKIEGDDIKYKALEHRVECPACDNIEIFPGKWILKFNVGKPEIYQCPSCGAESTIEWQPVINLKKK